MVKSWHFVEVCIPGSLEESTSSLLFELGTTGIVTTAEDPETVSLGAYFDLEFAPSDLTTAIRNSFSGSGRETDLIAMRVSRVDDCDWMQKWKEGFEPIEIGDRLIVAPSWRLPQNSSGRLIVQIDPGMAFGTGTHETTRLCLQALERLWPNGTRLLDVGTGTGILAISAAKLSPESQIVAIDIDPLAIEIAMKNAEVNFVADRIDFRETSADQITDCPFDTLVANLTAETIIDQIDQFARCLNRSGILILSGILDEFSADVERGVRQSGFAAVESRQDGEWIALVARFE